jgi:8-oxo-dGTP pyrophosphatase MutT (NUDIX family)
MENEESFGIIPIKVKNDKYFTFLVKLKSGNHTGFPKGHKNSIEKPLDTAIRELKEETNLNFEKLLYDQPLMEEYQIKKGKLIVQKKVYYYIAEVKGKVILDKNEILDGYFIELDKAIDKITYNPSKEIAKKALDFLTIK